MFEKLLDHSQNKPAFGEALALITDMKTGLSRLNASAKHVTGSLLILLTAALPFWAWAEASLPRCEFFLAQTTLPSETLSARVADWKRRAGALATLGGVGAFKLDGEISDFAAGLIRTHRNEEFLWLAGQLEFPINPISFAGTTYGSSLLAAAILSKNYEIYKRLPTLANEYLWHHLQEPILETWSPDLVEVVTNDSVFYKDSLSIAVKDHSNFERPSDPRGVISSVQLKQFEDIAKTKDVQALANLLAEIYPSATLKVTLAAPGQPPVEGELDFFHSQIYRKAKGDNRRLRLQVHVLPSQARTSERRKTLEPRHSLFSLQIEPEPINWIREMKVTAGSVEIIIERNDVGQHMDAGDRYEALILHLDPNGVIQRMDIGDGNHLFFRRLWTWTEVFTDAVAMFTRPSGPN